MRKATKVLLLIAEIMTFVSIGAFFFAALIFIIIGADIALLSSIVGESMEAAKMLAPIYILIGFVFFIPVILTIITGVMTHKTRKDFSNGVPKDQIKGRAIALIILGALCSEIVIIPAIFLLIIGPDKYHN